MGAARLTSSEDKGFGPHFGDIDAFLGWTRRRDTLSFFKIWSVAVRDSQGRFRWRGCRRSLLVSSHDQRHVPDSSAQSVTGCWSLLPLLSG
ncbi:uncharacterized protein STAUR_2530 [Stigmatella aurantiaca DW4/3-1]|uniref:Uncharacterized protein n=1 Tax=Stigmatella aurantiaca (strain DW4/3-1) TaxID=378806 RepID=E3FHR2_STIAD|nr:uncharacterized protein STAUR_2530 [Stigmatella aurantiaca DW4/3-1]